MQTVVQTWTKEGTKTNGAKWKCHYIKTADGTIASSFNESAAVGDTVTISRNKKDENYNDFKIAQANEPLSHPVNEEPKRSYAEPNSYQKPDPTLGRIANALERIATALENKDHSSQEDSFVDDVLGSVQQDMGI